VTHEQLGFGRVRQQRQTPSGFDLIGDPVPVTDAFQSDGSPWGQFREEGTESAAGVVDAESAKDLGSGILDLELGVVLVGVTADEE
jgi:hypothetical protein